MTIGKALETLFWKIIWKSLNNGASSIEGKKWCAHRIPKKPHDSGDVPVECSGDAPVECSGDVTVECSGDVTI